MSKAKPKATVRVYAYSPEADSLLTLQRAASDSRAHQFEVPGGGVEPGEDIFMTASRELGEETGIWLAPSAFEEVRTFGPRLTSRGKLGLTAFVKTEVEYQEPRLDPLAHQDYDWISRPSVPFKGNAEEVPLLWTPTHEPLLISEEVLALTSILPHLPQAQGLYFYSAHHWQPIAAMAEVVA